MGSIHCAPFRAPQKKTLASSIPARVSVFWSDQGVYGIMSRKKWVFGSDFTYL